MDGQLHCDRTSRPIEGPSRWNAGHDAHVRFDDWLLDQPLPRARDLRYRPDQTPLATDRALVDRVLGVDSTAVGRVRRDEMRGGTLQTHWTRILAHDLDANDDEFASGTRRNAWEIVGKAAMALTAAYVVVYLMVAAVVYLARAPDTASTLLPDLPSAPARTDFPLDRPTAARAS